MNPPPTEQKPPFDPSANTADWLVCTACGTQFPTADRTKLTTCFICDDPRQYTPPSGQAFTTLASIRASGHRNVFTPLVGTAGPDGGEPRIVQIVTEPKVGIGQRALLVRTPAGNILWDCVTLLDDETVRQIRGEEEVGGLHAIVISHPHFYSSHAEWAAAFGCPVYLADEDRAWTSLASPAQVFLGGDGGGPVHDIKINGNESAFRAIRLGGHFPGSMVGLFDGHLLVADTLLTTPAGVGSWEADAQGTPRSRPKGMNSFSFMWSIPNMIPLSADEIARMWGVLRGLEFRGTHGGFLGQDIEDEGVKGRVLESMQIQVKSMGWKKHPMMMESL